MAISFNKNMGKFANSILWDMFRVLLTYPGLFAASILSTVVVAGVEPSFAWMGKNFVDDLKKGKTDFSGDLLHYGMLFGGLLLGLGILKFGDKMIDKIYELKLVIRLQRLYLERRTEDRGIEDVSRVIFDCDRAKAGLDIIHKDIGKIVFQTISVLIWQFSLAREWIPALLIAVLPPILVGLVFGRFIQQASLNRLQAQQAIASSTCETQRLELFSHQDFFFRQTIKLEIFKSSTEILMELVTWFGLLMLVLVSSVFHLGLIPQKIEAGDLALFVVNLNLLAKPLGETVKVYNKGREAYPALLRVLRPEPLIVLE
jgi:ABC-type multidrug transport system fused ATPase/permease subunit